MGSETIKKVDGLDCTPTWETMMGVILNRWDSANDKAREAFRQECMVCAHLADQRNKLVRELKAGKDFPKSVLTFFGDITPEEV